MRDQRAAYLLERLEGVQQLVDSPEAYWNQKDAQDIAVELPRFDRATTLILSVALSVLGCTPTDFSFAGAPPPGPCGDQGAALQPGAPWPMQGRCPNHRSASDVVAAQTGVWRWMFQADYGIVGSPAIGADGTVYIGDVGGNLYAIAGDTGAERWRAKTGAVNWSGVTIAADGTLYLGLNAIAAISAGGASKYLGSASGLDQSVSIGSDGTLYVGSHDGHVYAMQPDGTPAWQTQFAAGGDLARSSPAIGSDGVIYVGSADGKLYAIGPEGTSRWNYPTTGALNQSSPTIDRDGTIYIGSADKKLHAVTPNGHAPKWSPFTAGGAISSSPAVGSDGTVYFGADDRKLYALGPDGAPRWQYQAGSAIRSSPAVGADGTVYVGCEDSKLYAVKNGELTFASQMHPYGGPEAIPGAHASPAIGADGTVYAAAGNHVVAFGAKSAQCGADLATDPHHCGACGHSCLDGACSAGVCEPVRIADGQLVPQNVAVNKTQIFWTTDPDYRVWSMPLSGGPPVALTPPQPYPFGVTANDATVYWANVGTKPADYVDGAIMMMPATGGTVATVAAGEVVPAYVAVVGDAIYWTSEGKPNNGFADGAIRTAVISGGVPGAAATLASGLTRPFAIAVHGSYVYWTSWQSPAGTVMRVRADGKQPAETIAKNQDAPWAIAVDNEAIFWLDRGHTPGPDGSTIDGSVWKFQLGGGDAVKLADKLAQPTAIAIDARYVYWLGYHRLHRARRDTGGDEILMPLSSQPTDASRVGMASDASQLYWATGAGEILRWAK